MLILAYIIVNIIITIIAGSFAIYLIIDWIRGGDYNV